MSLCLMWHVILHSHHKTLYLLPSSGYWASTDSVNQSPSPPMESSSSTWLSSSLLGRIFLGVITTSLRCWSALATDSNSALLDGAKYRSNRPGKEGALFGDTGRGPRLEISGRLSVSFSSVDKESLCDIILLSFEWWHEVDEGTIGAITGQSHVTVGACKRVHVSDRMRPHYIQHREQHIK